MHRIALLIALLALSAGAAAQREADKMAPGFLTTFLDYDSNGDGIVTVAEVESLVEAAHVRAARACDTDGDQRLSLDEYNICNGTSSDPPAGDAPR